MKTMICLILDRSGSMQGRETDVIGGVNQLIEDQKKLPDQACMTFVRFNTGHIERFREMKPLADVEPLKPDEFKPRGGTPLLDAVGQTITQLDEDWKKEQPDRAIVVIVTDGQENASHEYTHGKIKDMIQARENSQKWSFIYLGANVDAFKEGGAIGVRAVNTANYTSSAKGTGSLYRNLSASMSAKRQATTDYTFTAGITAGLGGTIREDGTVDKSASHPHTVPGSGAWTPPTAETTSNTATWTPPV